MCGEPEVVDRMFKIDIVNGSPVMFHVHAIVQRAHIRLNKVIQAYKKIYAGREYEISAMKTN